MADDKTTKMPEQPVTDTGPGKETPPEPEKTPTPPEAEKKTEQQAKSPQVSVYDFAEIMKGKKAEERAAASGGEKPAPAKTEKPEKQPEAPKKAEGKQEKPKECALPGFVDSKNEEKTERNAGYLVVSHSGGGMLRQGTRKGIRRTPANRGMRAHWVVKGLDISEDVCHGMCP